MASAVVILAEGFEEIEAVTVIDVLRRAKVDVTVAGLGSMKVKGARGQITVIPDMELKDAPKEPDAIILPGGMPGSSNLADSPLVAERVVANYKAGRIVAAICAAPAVALAKFGVLDGREATCFPGFEKNFPDTVTYVDDPVVTDANIITSQGVGTAMYFALALVDALVDEETSDALAEQMLVN